MAKNQILDQDLVDATKDTIREVNRINSDYHYFNVICEEEAMSQAKSPHGKLRGYFISVKDCIAIKGVEARAGSKILTGYVPVFDATAVKKIKDAGGVIIGKTSQDEFGFGSFNTNTGIGFKIPKNPIDPERVCGGSSGGSAGITKLATFKHIALAESTGGSIACPASFCGVIGLTPTYSLVSRYGLLDYANSLDKIGIMAKKVTDAALLLEVIAGHDPLDSTSSKTGPEKYSESISKSIKGMKIAVLKESFHSGVDEDVQEITRAAIRKLEQEGATVVELSLPLTMKYALSAYYIIAMSEASTNLAKYCGIRYGETEKLEGGFNEYFSKVRGENFGQEAKRRILLGSFARMAGYRDAYYTKAMKVRTKIIEEYKDAFKHYDAIISPTMPFIAPKIEEIKKLTPLQSYTADILTVGPNLAGLPHITVNAGYSKKMPVGIMITGDHFQEKKILSITEKLEEK